MSMQKVAPEKYQEQIFDGLTELEEQKTKEALELVQRKHKLVKWEGKGASKDFAKVGVVRSSGTVFRSLR